jgi:hypothetical protein
MSFVSLSNVRSLLHLFQRQVTASFWKRDPGYIESAPVTLDPFNQDKPHFVDTVRDLDRRIKDQWRSSKLSTPQAFFDISQLPPTHFVRATRPGPGHQPNQDPHIPGNRPETAQQSCRRIANEERAAERAAAANRPCDFVAREPPFVLVILAPHLVVEE